MTIDIRTGYEKLPGAVSLRTRVESHHAVLAELCSRLFVSLSRRDQRRRALEYVHGLLVSKGRKSIRNIAAVTGEQAAEQRLHHFICSSTWDWVPVRQALAEHVSFVAPPQAWVARTMIIPKAGEQSVGVDRRFFSDLGQVCNAQHAVGIWAASAELCSPVNWWLRLSPAWLDDDERRTRAAIPEDTTPETLGNGAIGSYLELVAEWRLPPRPFVLDARYLDAAAVVRRLRAVAAPFLIRICDTTQLAVAEPALTGHRANVLPAHHIMRAAQHLRRPVEWRGTGPAATPQTSLVAASGVRLPAISGEPKLTLLAASRIGAAWPQELWLTNLPCTDLTTSLRLTRLVGNVDDEFPPVAEQVGVRDFTGRSYRGWHRHVTLASVAHAVVALGNRSGRAESNEA